VTRDDDFLSRWSRRKHASRRGEKVPEPAPEDSAAAAPATASGLVGSPPAPSDADQAPAELPQVESLTPESDFTPFMRNGVDPTLRQQALRTLFRDPRFNVMDGLDVYIDDYSKPDPIPPDWLGKMNQMARLGDYKPPEADPEPEQERAESTDADPIRSANQELEAPPEAPREPDDESSSPNPESKGS
jgi:hypothetical protein